MKMVQAGKPIHAAASTMRAVKTLAWIPWRPPTFSGKPRQRVGKQRRGAHASADLFAEPTTGERVRGATEATKDAKRNGRPAVGMMPVPGCSMGRRRSGRSLPTPMGTMILPPKDASMKQQPQHANLKSQRDQALDKLDRFMDGSDPITAEEWARAIEERENDQQAPNPYRPKKTPAG